jgi:hypothetical protein
MTEFDGSRAWGAEILAETTEKQNPEELLAVSAGRSTTITSIETIGDASDGILAAIHCEGPNPRYRYWNTSLDHGLL